jgi:EmrB/QacA subfamily drug resistance transporter
MAAVGIGVFLGTIDISIVNVTLPVMMKSLGADFPTIQWVVLSYLFTLTNLMLSVGRLADIQGKKKIYHLGFVIFTLGSLLCGLAPGAGWLIAFRVVQAVGGAMVTGLGAGIVTEAFPPKERGKALGLIGTIVSVGIAAGPALGGYLVGVTGDWPVIFFVNVPVGIIGTLMVGRLVPDDTPGGGQKFDFGGAGALFISLLSLLLGLTLGQRWGFGAPTILALFGSFAISLVLFLWLETKVAQPMIDLSLFKSHLFSIGLLTGFITFIAIGGATMILPFYLEDVQGYTTKQTGLLMSVLPVMLSFSSPASGALSDRLGTRGLATAGLLVMVAAFMVLRTLEVGTTTLGYILRVMPLGIGVGIFISPNNSAIMGAVSPQRLGIASGFLAFTRTLGQTVGIAVIGTIFAVSAAGHSPSADLAAAGPLALTAGLQDVMLIGMLLIFATALISAGGFWLEYQAQRRAPADVP